MTHGKVEILEVIKNYVEFGSKELYGEGYKMDQIEVLAYLIGYYFREQLTTEHLNAVREAERLGWIKK